MVKPAERAVRQHVEHALPVELDACGALEIPGARGTRLIGGHTAQSQNRRNAIARQCPPSIVMVTHGDTENTISESVQNVIRYAARRLHL